MRKRTRPPDGAHVYVTLPLRGAQGALHEPAAENHVQAGLQAAGELRALPAAPDAEPPLLEPALGVRGQTRVVEGDGLVVVPALAAGAPVADHAEGVVHEPLVGEELVYQPQGRVYALPLAVGVGGEDHAAHHRGVEVLEEVVVGGACDHHGRDGLLRGALWVAGQGVPLPRVLGAEIEVEDRAAEGPRVGDEALAEVAAGFHDEDGQAEPEVLDGEVQEQGGLALTRRADDLVVHHAVHEPLDHEAPEQRVAPATRAPAGHDLTGAAGEVVA
jgi:hypothetical protein